MKKIKRMRKRIGKSILLTATVLCFVLGMFPAAALAQGSQITYVALGDSITAGYGLGDGEQSFAEKLASDKGYSLKMLAESGDTSANLLAKIQNPANAETLKNADLITISIGGNDLMNALYDYLAEKYNQANGTALGRKDIQAKLLNLKPTDLGEMAGYLSGFEESDAAAEALRTFGTNLTIIAGGIRQLNPDAVVIVCNQYHPYKYLVNSLKNNPMFTTILPDVQKIDQVFDSGIAQINNVIRAVGNGNYSIAEVYDVINGAIENPCNASVGMNTNLDFHPNAEGHKLIAQAVEAAIASDEKSVSMQLAPAEQDFGSVDIGYEDVSEETFTVTNTGILETAAVSVELAGEGFVLDGQTEFASLKPGESFSFTAAPAADLAAGTYAADITVSVGGKEMTGCKVTFTVVQAYTLTVENGQIVTGNGPYHEGDVVTIRADKAPSGKEFSGWTASAGVLGDASKEETIFTMPAADVMLKAHYETSEPASADKNNTEDKKDTTASKETAEKSKVPGTGDESSPAFWFIIGGTALASAAGVAAVRKKKA